MKVRKGVAIRMTLAVVMAFCAGFAIQGRGSVLWASIAAGAFYLGALLKLWDGEDA